MSLLNDIVDSKRAGLDAVRDLVRARANDKSRTPLAADAVLARARGAPLRLVAEVKRKSPSAGALSRVLSPGDRAVAYARAGAAMVSVLTDGPYFDGAWSHVTEARAALDAAGKREARVPVLAKEFVIDEAQIECARLCGADAVLLIVRLLSPEKLRQFVTHADSLSITPLVEVATDAELDCAIEAGAHVIGVNVRDLDTLAMDAARAAKILARVPPGVIAIHLSGVRDADAVCTIARGRADAALVGEALMRADDPTPLVQDMVRASAG